MEPAESRYAHLLQPIRELTKNWEIDVASELNDYLEEVCDRSGGTEPADVSELLAHIIQLHLLDVFTPGLSN
uniref:Condensin-2 complex subunit H2 n=1 Tax=Fundulus heteroclitus TaxID=8078 RepID=A0A3Q2PD94_FUNHE